MPPRSSGRAAAWTLASYSLAGRRPYGASMGRRPAGPPGARACHAADAAGSSAHTFARACALHRPARRGIVMIRLTTTPVMDDPHSRNRDRRAHTMTRPPAPPSTWPGAPRRHPRRVTGVHAVCTLMHACRCSRGRYRCRWLLARRPVAARPYGAPTGRRRACQLLL
jgi:hypothetical protein